MIAAVSSTVNVRSAEPSASAAPLELVVEREGAGRTLELHHLRDFGFRVEVASDRAVTMAVALVESEAAPATAGHA